jgi:hypothetical protein
MQQDSPRHSGLLTVSAFMKTRAFAGNPLEFQIDGADYQNHIPAKSNLQLTLPRFLKDRDAAKTGADERTPAGSESGIGFNASLFARRKKWNVS